MKNNAEKMDLNGLLKMIQELLKLAFGLEGQE